MQFTYDIGGKTFTQRKLVLGQVRQIMGILPQIKFSGDLSPLSLVITFEDELPRALAVVLREGDRDLKDKDVEALAAWLDEHCDPETALQVVRDFFDCNPLSSLSARLGELSGRIQAAMGGGSTGSSCSSPEATSPGATEFSGDTPPTSASSGPSIEGGNSCSARPC